MRDQAATDMDCVRPTLDGSGSQKITPAMTEALSTAAHSGMRREEGGYRRERLHAFAQRAEVADDEVRIGESKAERLQTLVAASRKTAGGHISVLKWRTRHDSNV